MPAVSTRSRRVKKESPVLENDEPQVDDIKKSRPSRKKKEITDNSVAEVPVRESARTPAGKRQAAKRKQQQDEEHQEDRDENGSKKRRVTRKSSVTAVVEQNERITPRNAGAGKRKVEEKPESPVSEPKARKSNALKVKPQVEPKKRSTPAEETDEPAPNGRSKRASARKSSVVLLDFDPDEESETDFSDNDDDDFVLPESDKSEEEEEEIPEDDLEPEPFVAPAKTASRKVTSTRSKSKKEQAKSRSDRIREFLLDVDQSAPPELLPKTPKSEPRETPKKVEKPNVPARAPATVKFTPTRSTTARRSTKVSEISISDEEEDPSATRTRSNAARRSTKVYEISISDGEEEPSATPSTSATARRSTKVSEMSISGEEDEPSATSSRSTTARRSTKVPEISISDEEVEPSATPSRPITARRSMKVSEVRISDEEDGLPTVNSRKQSRATAKATPSTKNRKKRIRLSSEDSSDSIVAPKKVKSSRVPKVTMKNRKTFMKPRKGPIQRRNDDGTSIETSLFEKSLLKLAKRMDDGDDSENSEGDEEKKVEQPKEGDAEKAGDVESKEGSPKPDSEAKAREEADKKRLILSMLKEHEPVDDMSDGSSDDDDQPEPRKLKKQSEEKKVEKTEDVTEIKLEPGDAQENEAAEKKSKGKKEKISEKAAGKKGAAKKKVAIKTEKVEESSDSEDENWEVVEDAAIRDPNYKRPDNVTVVLQAEDFISDGKKGLTMEQRMIRLINRRRRGVALYSHRVHLLTLIAYHRWLNSIVHSDPIKAYALSILPPSLALPAKSRDEEKIIRRLFLMYEREFELLPSGDAFVPRKLKGNLLKLLVHKKTYCNITYVFGLLALLRVCEIRSRLCLSYRLTPHKAVQLRIKDGEMFEVGAKTKAPSVGTGIDDYFVEIYISDKKRWRPIDIENFTVMEDPQDLNPHLEQPVSHLIGIDDKGCMVDLSPKYNADWLNRVKTLRGDPKFIEEVLQRYAPEGKDQIREKKEVASKHDQQGLPKVISEYKNHPKYALRRHLLKHEAFYPREPPILGEIRGEPVYPRENVFLLHSREQWYRKARSVKEGEEPYNVVTARPKFDRRKETWVKDIPMEIFGEWQTERFKPPSVVDGKIPRNKYGNVDLFHPDLLPIGAAHLKLPMLNRVATDLGVDCVPAVIGFDGLGRAFHAVFEGFVVCEEDKERLEKAWHERQYEDRHTRRERARTRAVRNWKMIIKKVIWDLRLKKKYKNNLEQEKRS